jgi:hypothetical protein
MLLMAVVDAFVLRVGYDTVPILYHDASIVFWVPSSKCCTAGRGTSLAGQ